MEGKVLEIARGRVRGLRRAVCEEVDDRGEVWKYQVGRDWKCLLVPKGQEEVWWGDRRLMVMNRGDVVAWSLDGSGYNESVIPALVEGVVVRKAIANLRGGFDWKKWLVIGGLVIAGIVAVMFMRGQLAQDPAGDVPDELINPPWVEQQSPTPPAGIPFPGGDG